MIEAESGPMRRGLPRVAGGPPWPPAPADGDAPVASPRDADAEVVERSGVPGRRAGIPRIARRGVRWVVAVGCLAGAALLVVLACRWLVTLDGLRDFLATYPGETPLPAGAPVGFPAWLAWQHFLNVFLMVLIVRSGLQIRRETRPRILWASRRNPARKISLTTWFHQVLDLAWILNGALFVVLLVVSGQWVRVVPTSWEILPNAVSAALQYGALDWPTENGWVNYNSLQVLAYFVTIFVAAPLAALSGVRMSAVWPRNAPRLDRIYPIEWARAVHFPVMLYFVAFVVVHVSLVLATGAMRNLNHMYAVQGSTDPEAFSGNWAGFAIFVASIVVIAIAWAAARPVILASIARAFGTVSGR